MLRDSFLCTKFALQQVKNNLFVNRKKKCYLEENHQVTIVKPATKNKISSIFKFVRTKEKKKKEINISKGKRLSKPYFKTWFLMTPNDRWMICVYRVYSYEIYSVVPSPF